MKCFVAVLALAGVASSAPQHYIADTPEVQQAKIEFAQAYNARARTASAALADAGVNVANPEDHDYSPAAEAYVHVDIPAEPYVHQGVPYVHQEGEAAPVAPAAPVVTPVQAPVQAPVQVAQPFALPANFGQFGFAGQQFVPQQFVPQQFAPQQFAAPVQQRAAGGCYNWKGEGVECRF